MRIIGFYGFANSLLILPVHAEETGSSGGMISIEVVENPSFYELYGNYLYLAVILLFLGIFFWRRRQQRRGKE